MNGRIEEEKILFSLAVIIIIISFIIITTIIVHFEMALSASRRGSGLIDLRSADNNADYSL